MSRELKFRCWNNCSREYIPENELMDNFAEYLREEHLYIEQYTGLKDKNGKEIYEGDIVAVRDEDIPFALVNAMTTNKWVVRFGMHRAAFTLVKSTKKRNFIRTFQHIKPKDIEIIGNIHENPELLMR